MWRNTEHGYGAGARLFHWLLALALAGMFGLGWYMVGLGYYHPWRKSSVDLHRSIGIIVSVVIAARIAWALFDRHPAPVPGPRWERWAAKTTHIVLYLLMIALPISGYLISTADGRAFSVFGLFEVPAMFGPVEGMETVAGQVHYLLAFGGAWLVLLHIAAALKHQFINRDGTLMRMVRGRP